MKLHKKEIARRQIDTAIELFFRRKDYLSIVTLASAGEEIIGNLLERANSKNMVGYLVDLDKKLTGAGRPFEVVNHEINGFRNSLKHAKDPNEDEIDVAQEQEHAIAMLSRAITNYNKLERRLSGRMEEFYDWLRQNRPDLFTSNS